MKKFLLGAVALCVLLSGAAQSMAQALKPVVIVSLAGYDELMSDVDFLGQATGLPFISPLIIEAELNKVTQGQGLKGLDKKLPWGGALLTDGTEFRPLVFLPIADVKSFVENLAFLQLKIAADADGTFKITPPQGMAVFAKSQGNYTFFAQQAAQLSDLPPDPAGALDGLNKDYDLAVRAYVQNVPDMYRKVVVNQLRMGMQLSLRQTPGEDETAFQIRKQLVEQQLKQIETAVNELDKFTLGLKIDGTGKTVHLDIGATVAAGSKMAKQMGELASLKSDHGGFMQPDGALNFSFVSPISPEDAKQAVSVIRAMEIKAQSEIEKDNSFPNTEVRAAAKDILADLFNIGVSTIESGKLDGGAALSLEPNSVSFTIGGYVFDGAALETTVKKLHELVKNEPGFPVVKFNAEKHKGVTFHTTSIPVPEDPDARKMFGASVDVIVGIGPKSFYVSLGRKANEQVKKVIDKSEADAAKVVPPMQLILALAPIFKFVDSVQPNQIPAPIAAEVSKTAGKDHVSLIARPVPNGVSYRLQLEEGVLKVIGQGAGMAMMGGGF